MTFFISPEDLGTYLGATVDIDRAQFLIDQATDLCTSIVDPLPDAATSVVLDVAARAYANPTSVPNQAVGPFSMGGASGGLWLTRQNKSTLRRLAGSGGAFTIDTMPTTAGSGLPWWDTASSAGGDWDQVP